MTKLYTFLILSLALYFVHAGPVPGGMKRDFDFEDFHEDLHDKLEDFHDKRADPVASKLEQEEVVDKVVSIKKNVDVTADKVVEVKKNVEELASNIQEKKEINNVAEEAQDVKRVADKVVDQVETIKKDIEEATDKIVETVPDKKEAQEVVDKVVEAEKVADEVLGEVNTAKKEVADVVDQAQEKKDIVNQVDSVKKNIEEVAEKVREVKKEVDDVVSQVSEDMDEQKVSQKKETMMGEEEEENMTSSERQPVSIRSAETGEEPENTTLWAKNPCDTNKNFNYYQSYPKDPTKYIQCDPWGTGLVRTCQKDTVWNMWALRCDRKENVHNMTFSIPPKVFNCSLVGYECVNGGVCSESQLGGYRCVCKPEFTGQFCESNVEINDLTHVIQNGTFSVRWYREQLAQLNMSNDVTEFERYKEQLDEHTYSELMKYISMYKGNEIRYDTLLNNLVENILEDLYPDAAYLSQFNASSINIIELVRLIPNILSYSRYSFERYQDVFQKYQSVLVRLTQTMNKTDSRCREEAAQYTRLTAIFLNQTLTIWNQTVANSENVHALLENQGSSQHQQMTETDVRGTLRNEFNSTLEASEKLLQILEKFQDAVVRETQVSSEIFRQTLGEALRIEGAVEVQRLLNSITESSIQIWDSLVNYGFWYITSYLTDPLAADVAMREAAKEANRELAAAKAL